jgi:hypothetical protein
MTRVRLFLESLIWCLVYSFVVILVDFVLILIFGQDLDRVILSLSFVLLVEGSVGLIVGGALGMNSPIIARIGESVFHSKTRGAEGHKGIEKQAKSWILTGLILVFAALLLSAL